MSDLGRKNARLIHASFLVQVGFLLVQTWHTGHFPLSNLYESLLCLSCALTWFIGMLPWTATWTTTWTFTLIPTIGLLQLFIAALPSSLKSSNGLVPALQSNWLQMHVVVMVGAYVCLMLGCLLAIVYLVFSRQQSGVLTNSAQMVDSISYRSIGLGFAFLTAGLLSGAVWANQTWGSYWSWDPKETWALITWIVFAMYLHVRLSDKYNRIQSAWFALAGLIVLWICYLGVNLIAKGLHSYGFLS